MSDTQKNFKKMDKYATGIKGEVIAKDFLIKKGYKIIATNVNYPNVGELDIVAMDGKILVFIEVRTRSDDLYGEPFSTMTKAKIKKIIASSRKFLMQNKIFCDGYRYDVIGIFRENIEHLENAFYAYW